MLVSVELFFIEECSITLYSYYIVSWSKTSPLNVSLMS